MFTDIVGYTALMGKDEAKAMDLVHMSHEIQKRLVEEFEGDWLKEMGDGIMCSFPSASDAIYCALEIQEQLFQQQDLQLRIGIHLGEVLFENGDIFSDGVNIASRLQAIAEPGGIYLSESVQKAIRGQTDIHTVYLGEMQLKNVDYRVKTYALQGEDIPLAIHSKQKRLFGSIWTEIKRKNLHRAGLIYLLFAGILLSLIPWIPLLKPFLQLLTSILLIGFIGSMVLAWYFERSSEGFIRASSQKSRINPYSDKQKKPQELLERSIAVLPFDNLGNDPDQLCFVDGIQEDILTQLSKNPELKVKSRTSTLKYRDMANKTMVKIGKELGAAHMLEGSVRSVGRTVRVTAQLIEVQSDNHIWSEVYDRELTDTLATQLELAFSIARGIGDLLTKMQMSK